MKTPKPNSYRYSDRFVSIATVAAVAAIAGLLRALTGSF